MFNVLSFLCIFFDLTSIGKDANLDVYANNNSMFLSLFLKGNKSCYFLFASLGDVAPKNWEIAHIGARINGPFILGPDIGIFSTRANSFFQQWTLQ